VFGGLACAVLSHSFEAYADARASGASADGSEVSSPLVTGIAPGLGSYKGKWGPWLEVFVGHDFRLGRRFVLRLEGAFLYTSYSEVETYQEGEGFEYREYEGTDEVWAAGGMLRGLAAYELNPAWALRAGVLLGYASEHLSSTVCGEATLSNPFHGLSIGSALRVGSARRFELGLNADFVAYPLLSCSPGFPPTVSRRDELSYDDPTIALTARLGYHW
jgi:hypothetical protein